MGDMEDLNFQPAQYPPEAFSYHEMMRRFGLPKAQAKRAVADRKAERVLRSTTHQVAMRRVASDVLWLNVKRLDRSPILERMELGRIAGTIAPDRIWLELLPLPLRKVDTANQYHAFGLTKERFPSLTTGASWAEPPHHGDWRELQTWKEHAYPDQEGALVLSGDAERVGKVLLAPAGAYFPFGFTERAVIEEGIGGAVQRPFQEGAL
jgi:hypothetical protein